MKRYQTVLELQSGHDFVTDRQTDRRPGQKQDVAQPYGGRHNKPTFLNTALRDEFNGSKHDG